MLTRAHVLAVSVAAIWFHAASAAAVPITLQFIGVVDTVDLGLTSVSVGDPYTGTLTYDSASASTGSTPIGTTYPVSAWSMQVGSFTLDSSMVTTETARTCARARRAVSRVSTSASAAVPLERNDSSLNR